MEAVTWGPASSPRPHTYDEHVDLAAAKDGLEALLNAAQEILDGDNA